MHVDAFQFIYFDHHIPVHAVVISIHLKQRKGRRRRAARKEEAAAAEKKIRLD
jgi:hypothetical protein